MTGSLQIKNGKYYAVINTYENGKRKQKWIDSGLSVKGNKTKAEKFLREQITILEKKVNIISHDALLSDYIEHWLGYCKAFIDEVTYNGYVEIINAHILPYFNKLKTKLSDVNYQILQRYFDEKAENGRIDGKGGLSANSLKRHKNVLSQTLDLAIKEGYIQSNFTKLCELPKVERREPTFYTKEQVAALLKALKDDDIFPAILLTVYLGLRRSELCGLQWDSVDFENGFLTIKHTVVSYGGRIEKDKTKNQSSRRSYPLSDEIIYLFLEIKSKQEENKALFGKGYHTSNYIFTWDDGRPISPDYISHKFGKLLKKYNLPHIRFHDLRHTCASLLISNGGTLKDAQEWLGHASITMTANVYGHLDIERKQTLSKKMQSLLDIKEC